MIARDRPDVRQARDEVAASHATVNAIIEPAPAGIFVVDADLSLTVWNPACEELFGWTAAGMLIYAFYGYHHSELRKSGR